MDICNLVLIVDGWHQFPPSADVSPVNNLYLIKQIEQNKNVKTIELDLYTSVL